VEKAKKNGFSVDKQIKLDAEYILADELFKQKESLAASMDKIRGNPDWMKDIERKAKENNIPVEEQTKRDAQWLIDNEKK
jgi:hypothetical protein